MRLYQESLEENSIASVIAHLVFYAFVVIVATDGQFHPIAHPAAIAVFLGLNLPKLYFIYLSKGKSFEVTTAFILILATAMFWSITYLLELLAHPYLNHTNILLFVGINGIAYGGSLSFYKRPRFNYLFVAIIVALPLLFTLFFLQELKIPIVIVFFM